MYEVDDRDRVTELDGVLPSDAGAPIPHVLADEHTVLAYYLQDEPRNSIGVWFRATKPAGTDEAIAIVRFAMCAAHMFGPPNDEAFAGHPLAGRGLHPYGAFRVEHSSWIRGLERINSVHPYHGPERYERLQHLISAFHDSTFECACETYDVRLAWGSIHDVIPEMVKLLKGDDLYRRLPPDQQR